MIAREDALVSASVAYSSLGVQVAEVSSSRDLDSAEFPCVIIGEEEVGLCSVKIVIITFPWPESVLIVLF